MKADQSIDKEDLADLRKQLIYRSWHRGCKETDIILGEFAKSELAKFSYEELCLYREFINENDWDIYAWILGKSQAVPEYNSWLIPTIRKFSFNE